MSTDEWESHNEGWTYEPPEGPPEMWDPEHYTELFDRVISRRVEWICQTCSKPFGTLERARSHVESQHSERLIQQAVKRSEKEADAR